MTSYMQVDASYVKLSTMHDLGFVNTQSTPPSSSVITVLKGHGNNRAVECDVDEGIML